MPNEVNALIERADKFVITTHAKPDGDAIGSVLAFAHYLRKRGKSAVVLNCDPTPFNLEWLPGSEDIRVFDGSVDQLKLVGDADVIAILDANAQSRLGPLGKLVRDAGGAKLLVDHHTDPETWFDAQHAREAVSSTGQLIHELITAFDPGLIDEDIAACIYVAMVTDTGSFRFSNVTPDVHRVVADIIERGGLDVSELHASIYDRKSLGSLRLLSRVLQSMQLAHDDQITYSIISRAMLEETGASIEETEGYVNWGLSLEGVRAAILFTETERGTKASFRSKGTDHVHRWAQALGGGGHPNASGAFVRKPLEQAISLVVSKAPEFLDLSQPDSEGDELSAEDREYLNMLQAMPRKSGKPV